MLRIHPKVNFHQAKNPPPSGSSFVNLSLKKEERSHVNCHKAEVVLLREHIINTAVSFEIRQAGFLDTRMKPHVKT